MKAGGIFDQLLCRLKINNAKYHLNKLLSLPKKVESTNFVKYEHETLEKVNPDK